MWRVDSGGGIRTRDFQLMRLARTTGLLYPTAINLMLFLAGCSVQAQEPERIPERIPMAVPIVRTVDSVYRVVCYYAAPSGAMDCEKF